MTKKQEAIPNIQDDLKKIKNFLNFIKNNI